MAAGDPITATITTMTAYNTIVNCSAAMTANAATSDTDALKQEYTFTPTKADSKCVLVISSSATGTGVANVTFAIPAAVNAFHAGALSTTFVKEQTSIIALDGKYKNASGSWVVTVTPGASDKLKTDMALTFLFIELP